MGDVERCDVGSTPMNHNKMATSGLMGSGKHGVPNGRRGDKLKIKSLCETWQEVATDSANIFMCALKE